MEDKGLLAARTHADRGNWGIELSGNEFHEPTRIRGQGDHPSSGNSIRYQRFVHRLWAERRRAGDRAERAQQFRRMDVIGEDSACTRARACEGLWAKSEEMVGEKFPVSREAALRAV